MLHMGPCNSVGMRRRNEHTDTQAHKQTDTVTDGRDHNTCRLAMPNAKCD